MSKIPGKFSRGHIGDFPMGAESSDEGTKIPLAGYFKS